ncbi:MAG: rRNA pseudouridine synthase [Alphaproteobacteria bacterium]|nr:rRNA pseudouridine synthase [Alphaproteobacteria bacterium]
MAERLAKFMARSGVCSRREAEEYIKQQRVTVNGIIVETPAFNVEGTEKILFDGEKLPQIEKTRLWLYYKPVGLITSHKDEQNRETVFDNLPSYMPRVVSVGRLDLNSEGLLLLTNNGELSRELELPKNAWSRRYRVRVHGRIDTAKLESLKNGVNIDGIEYGKVNVTIDSQNATNAWLTVSLNEGKNREVRKLMKYVGLDVARLIRVSYGPFQLGSLKKGEVKEVAQKVLQEQLGSRFKL